MKTQSEWNEYFFDMGYYYTEKRLPHKITEMRNRFSNKPAFARRLTWLDKGILKAKDDIVLGII